MGEVVPLPAKPKRGETAPPGSHFLCCSCSIDEGLGWIPIVQYCGDDNFTIVGLTCMGCARLISIHEGREAKRGERSNEDRDRNET